jgi:WD repeat-containing protein 19
LILADEKDSAVVYNPLNEIAVNISGWNSNCIGALWETNLKGGSNIFVAWTDSIVATFSYQQHSLKGSQCISFHVNTKLPYGFKPILLKENGIVCQSLGGALENVPLYSHREYLPQEFLEAYPNEVDQARIFRVLYLVGQEKCLWGLYPAVSNKKTWTLLAEALLQILQIDAAKKIFRIIGDIAMVTNLERILLCEDRQEMMGHICVLFGDFNLAQQFFLNSANPKEALYMRKDLFDWEQALLLAGRFAPEDTSALCLEYGSQLEMDGKYGEAHTRFEQALARCKEFNGSSSEIFDHEWACKSGYIRMTFALGDIPKGMNMLNDAKDKKLVFECISILESLKQYLEAGSLYEKSNEMEKAAECYIKVKNWNRLAQILSKVSTPRIFIQYGKAVEDEGKYAEAAGAYEKGKDYDSVIRILIDHLQDLDGGATLARQTLARESAKKIAILYVQKRNYENAIEFYLIAGMQSQALELAKQYGHMDFFARNVKDDASIELCKIEV